MKLSDFLFNPLHDFKTHYLRLLPGAPSQEALQSSLRLLYTTLSSKLRDYLVQPRSDFMQDLAHFFKSDGGDRALCNDHIG